MAEELNNYSNLFTSLDATFGFIRIIHPNEEELVMTKSAVRIIREILIRLGFSITPKAHILFDRVCDQQWLYEGLSDKREDWIEQSHQMGIRLENLTSRILKKYESKQTTQLSIFWRQTYPSLQSHNKFVMELTSRKRKVVDDTPRLAVRNQQAKTTIEREQWCALVNSNATVSIQMSCTNEMAV